MLPLPKSDDRTVLYLRYLVERGMADRYGEGWETPERIDRLAYELGVIEEQSFSAAFVMLADILGFCRREAIPYGPGRGSVGGSYVAYAVGIHEVDSLEYGLLFERFLNTERVSFPDVDIDVSQEHRGRVIQHIVDSYNRPTIDCITEEATLTCVEWPSALDARQTSPIPGTKPVDVVLITRKPVSESQVRKLVESVTFNESSDTTERTQKLIESVRKNIGSDVVAKSWNIMVADAPAAGKTTSISSNSITSMAAGMLTDPDAAATLTKFYEQMDIRKGSKCSAPTVIEPRLVLVDAHITTTKRPGQIVLQVGAFVRAGARAVIDVVLAARAQKDGDEAYAVATMLKKCLPDGANVTGGVKQDRELTWWLKFGHGDTDGFRRIAEAAGWMEDLLLLDGMFTHLGRHAAGVVILREEDLRTIPLLTIRNQDGSTARVTGYDMYALERLGYLKWDILGLRTLDVLAEAHRMIGGSGRTEDLMELWREHKDDPEVYELLTEADTVGIFQMETPGYRRVLKEFKPTEFVDIVHLNALYRPGALGYRERKADGSEGRNMVEIFIDRRHGRDPISYPDERLRPILEGTNGVLLFQEQTMRIARDLAGFTLAQADALRKAIGKKKPEEMAKLVPLWEAGTADMDPAVRDALWKNIDASSRYSWNMSHSYEYGIITCLCAILKSKLALPGLDGVPKHGFYGAEINSWDDKKDRQAGVIAEARRHARFMPPDANLAEDRFVLADDSSIVFGLNGIKGMGEANRSAILIERTVGGPFESYADFCARLPQVPTNMKRSLIACGAFDSLGESRTELLSTLPKGNRRWRVGLLCGCETTKNSPVDVGDELRCARCKHKTAAVAVEEVERKRWAVLEQINEDAKRALEGKGRTSPQPWEAALDGELLEPSAAELGDGEMQAIGHYITEAPMRPVLDALRRVEVAGTIGGEVASVEWRKDKNDNDYANVQLTLPDLTRQRVLAFHSVVALHRDKIEPRSQLLFRGKDDGDTFIANSCWVAGDYRHFMKVRLRNLDGEQEVRNFDGKTETIERLEAEGWRVTVI